MRPGEGHPSTGNFENSEGGLWLWSISLYGSSVWGTGMGVPLLEALQVMKGRLWGRGSLFMGLIWATWSGLFYHELEILVERRTGGGASLSEEASWRGRGGELLHWEPWKIC